jgi:hypothetical protein
MSAKSAGAGTMVRLTLGAIVLIALAAAFGIRFWRFGGAPPLPALLQGLTDSRNPAAQQAFVHRLRTRFPVGSSEAELVAELRKEGFRLRTEARAPQREVSYDRAAGLGEVCRRGGTVRWSADEAGKLTDISGGFYVYCS